MNIALYANHRYVWYSQAKFAFENSKATGESKRSYKREYYNVWKTTYCYTYGGFWPIFTYDWQIPLGKRLHKRRVLW